MGLGTGTVAMDRSMCALRPPETLRPGAPPVLPPPPLQSPGSHTLNSSHWALAWDVGPAGCIERRSPKWAGGRVDESKLAKQTFKNHVKVIGQKLTELMSPLEQLWPVRSHAWSRRCCRRHIPCQRTRRRRTISTCFAISSVRHPHLPSSHVALVLWHGCLTDSASAFADNRSWPPREPHAQPQVDCGLQTPAVTLLSDQRPRLPRHRRKVR